MTDRGREWGGPRYATIVEELTMWRRLGRRWHGPDGGGGGVEEERARGVDPAAVEEKPAWTR
jgi:hypothetical protein